LPQEFDGGVGGTTAYAGGGSGICFFGEDRFFGFCSSRGTSSNVTSSIEISSTYGLGEVALYGFDYYFSYLDNVITSI